MNKKQSGVTLIELSVVLLILVALAGLVSPYVGGTGQKAMCEATDVSIQNIKKVIMENYYVDTLGSYPTRKGTSDYNLTCLFEKCNWTDFDPVTNVGFRKGGYLQNGSQLKLSDVNQLDTSFTNSTRSVHHVNDNLVSQDPDVVMSPRADFIILDAWGRPIVLQVPEQDECETILHLPASANPEAGHCARLISAGAGYGIGMADAYCSDSVHSTKTACELDGKTWIGKAAIDTSSSNLDTSGQISPTNPRRNDDRIVYLNIPTPSYDQNTPCDQY